MVAIGLLVKEIFLFESVNTHTHTYTHIHTDGRTPARLQSYKLTLLAFGLGELKTGGGSGSDGCELRIEVIVQFKKYGGGDVNKELKIFTVQFEKDGAGFRGSGSGPLVDGCEPRI